MRSTLAQRIIALDARTAGLKKSMAQLAEETKAALSKVQADYGDANRRAGADINPRAARKHAQDIANASAADIQKRYQEIAGKAQADIDAAQLEVVALRQRQQQLLATLPPE